MLPASDLNPLASRHRKNILDVEAFAANRCGEFTSLQRAMLNRKLMQQGVSACGFILLGATAPLFFAVATIFGERGTAGLELIWLLVFGITVLAGAPGIVRGVRMLRSLNTARQELAANEIGQDDGEVRWIGDIYAPFVDGQRLKPVYPRLGLRPGQYQFCYLRRSQWLLSAELLMPGDNFDAAVEVQRVLAVTNRFRMDDLHENCAGRMAMRQRFRLWLPAPHSWPYSGRIEAQRSPQLFYGTIISIGLLLFLGLYGIPLIFVVLFLIFRLTVLIDTLTGHVEVIEGRGQREKPHSRYDGYRYLLGGLRFRVSGQAYNALIVGQRYRIYYARYSKRLLSIEPLLDDADKRGK
jgi:hypothetical protein